jgi:hypothetical protein
MEVVERFEDVPDFESEAEEVEYWETHSLGGEALERMGSLDEVLGPPRAPQE